MTAQLRHQFRRYARRRQNLQPFFDGQLGNIGPHQGSERILGRNAAEAVALLRTYIDAVHRGRVRIYIVGVPAELADLHQRSVQRQRVEPVDARLFARGLPIGVKQDALRRPQRLQPLVGAVEQHVEIEFGVAQKLVKARAVVIPRGEDQAAIDRDPRLDEAELVLGEDIAVHLLALHRRADEAAVGAERPAVIDAAVGKGVAGLRRADAHPAMRANVQRYVDLTAGGARYDDLDRKSVV